MLYMVVLCYLKGVSINQNKQEGTNKYLTTNKIIENKNPRNPALAQQKSVRARNNLICLISPYIRYNKVI